MKLIINYDLMNEIIKANKGFDLKRFNSKMELFIGIVSAVNLTTFFATERLSPTGMILDLLYGAFVFGSSEVISKDFNQMIADKRLNSLSSSLTKINIYTSLENIKQARLYKTQYKISHDEKVAIQQNKFFMLPTDGTFNADEVSLLQEHTIGTNEYVLSMGEPKKAHSKVFSKALSRQMQ